MKKTLPLLLLAALAALAAPALTVHAGETTADAAFDPALASGSGAGYYFFDTNELMDPPFRYWWLRQMGQQGWAGDNEYWTTTLPFDVRFCGVDYPTGSTLYVGSNGIIGFTEEAMDDPLNQQIPDPQPPNALMAIWWDDLRVPHMFVDQAEKDGVEYLAITYRPAYFADGSEAEVIKFQLQIYESEGAGFNNRIEMHYSSVFGDSWRDYGASATVGLENADGSEAALYLYEEPNLEQYLGVRFIDQLQVDSQIGAFNLLTPQDGVEVGVGVPVNFSWEEPPYNGSGELSYVLLLADNPELTGARELDVGDATSYEVVFGTFDAGSWYWNVRAEESLVGNTRLAENTYGFEVVLPSDEQPPVVAGQVPANGAAGVPTNTTIVFHCYDETGVDPSTIDFTVESDGGGITPNAAPQANLGLQPAATAAVPGELLIDDSNPKDVVCTFTPTGELPAALINCSVAAGLADTLGNATAAPVSWSFSTEGFSTVADSWGAIKALD